MKIEMEILHPCQFQLFFFSHKIETLNFNFDGGFDGLARAQLRNVVRRWLGKYETGRVLRFSEFVLLFQQCHFNFSSYVPLLVLVLPKLPIIFFLSSVIINFSCYFSVVGAGLKFISYFSEINAKQDDRLSDLSDLLGEIKDMAIDMGSQINRQNKTLDPLNDDVDELGYRVQNANRRGNRLLRK